MKRFLLILGLVGLVGLQPHPVYAGMLTPGAKLRTGAFWAYLDTKLNATVPGTRLSQEIDYESDLFLDESKVTPFFGLTYRFNKNHALLLSYFALHRSSARQIVSKPFEFEYEGETYRVAAGARLATLLDLDIYQLSYMYSFYATDTFLVAGTIGAHVVRVKNGYRGEIGVKLNDGVWSLSGKGINESLTAPLPDFGLLLHYKVTDNITLGLRAQYFQLKINDIAGSVLDLECEALNYLDNDKHWALGVAYQYYGVGVDYARTRYKLDLDIHYQGPMVFIQYDF